MAAPTYYNGVWTLVPDTCSSPVNANSASSDRAYRFTLDSWSSFVSSLLVDLTPGIVMGSIAAAGCLIFCLWTCVFMRRRARIQKMRQAKKEAKGADQFMAAGDGSEDLAAAAAAQPQGCMGKLRRGWESVTAGRILKWAIVLLGLAVIGTSAWGMAKSIIATNSLVDSFWLLIDEVNQLVKDLNASLASLGASLAEVARTVGDVQGGLQGVTSSKIPVLNKSVLDFLPGDLSSKVNSTLGPTVTVAVDGLKQGSDIILNEVVPVINDTVLPAINDIYSQQGWTENLQDTWRYVVIAVMFGLLMLFAAATMWACFTMQHGLAACIVVALLWALLAAFNFVGMGMLNGAKNVSNDACLYTEDLIFRTLDAKLSQGAAEKARGAVSYYFGQTNLTDSKGNMLVWTNSTECDAEQTAALLGLVLDIDIATPILTVFDLAAQIPSISGTLNSINLPKIPFVNFDLDSLKTPVVDASDNLQGLIADVCNITQLLVRENRVWPLYVNTKTFICCDLTSALYDVWLPWVVAGSLALGLCMLASIRVVQATMRPVGRADVPLPATADGKSPEVADAVLGAAVEAAEAKAVP